MLCNMVMQYDCVGGPTSYSAAVQFELTDAVQHLIACSLFAQCGNNSRVTLRHEGIGASLLHRTPCTVPSHTGASTQSHLGFGGMRIQLALVALENADRK